MITIYTDGSARGNPGPGGWGAIVIAGGKVEEIGGNSDLTTNNKMELRAAIEALKLVGEEPAEIYTDSEYVLKGITIWVRNWQKNNWRTAARKEVLNKELWQELIDVTEGKDISWKLVAGHSGVPLNERCDMIATFFADGLPIELYNGPREGYKFI